MKIYIKIICWLIGDDENIYLDNWWLIGDDENDELGKRVDGFGKKQGRFNCFSMELIWE